ncbi:MAG: SDR family NAD(P)-dependent oxidoreductase [Bacteroidales bacterium]|nr:SDR family NAD(P)-dependent oxidoreductase [Bacteroidales bacterium]
MYSERDRKDKTALITGAASGIGFAFADNLARQGYDLLIVDIQEDKITQVAEQLKNTYHINIHTLALDLSTTDAPETIHAFCRENNIAIHILISNAGRFLFDAITDVENDAYNAFLQLHLNTPAKLCKLFGDDMKRRREGYILTMSSLSAWMPYPYLSLYASTKRFLRTFSRAIHFEFSPYNVGVTTVCPGAVDTGLFNLKPKLRTLAKTIGVMTTPDALAKRALRRMFRKRVTYIPGIINKISLPLLAVTPVRMLAFLYGKIKIT